MNKLVGQGIFSVLDELYPGKVFVNFAEPNEKLPLITFRIISGTKKELQSLISLEVNVWDNKGKDIETLEDMTERLAEELNKKVFNDGVTYLKFELQNILPMPDQDPKISRRILNFNVKYIDRRKE